jgi:uncharacterized RDD family membrane protein YckC
MQVWLIQDGKQIGPYQDYEIRAKLGGSDLSKDDFIWHEGLSGWKKISELDLFRSELDRLEVQQMEEDVSRKEREDASKKEEAATPPPLKRDRPIEKDVATPPPLKSSMKYILRRFWARWFDLLVYAAVWWLLMYAAGRDIGTAIRNLWLLLSMFIPWFALEAWLIHRFSRTPGKWLLGLSVKNEDGSNLSLKESIWRSIRVMITGVGFGWGLLSVLCQGMSWITMRRLGKPAWDYVGGHKVVAKPLNGFKVAILTVLFFVAFHLQFAVRGPHEQKAALKEYPELEKFLENGEKWYFPVKK